MSAALDATAVSAQTNARTSPADFNITLVGTGSNRQLMLFFTAHNNGGGIPTVSAVSVDPTGVNDTLSSISGTALTSGAERVEIWGGAITATGTVAVRVSFSLSGNNHYTAFYAISATGTDLVNNGTTTGPGTVPIDLAITSPSGDFSAAVLEVGSDGTGSMTDSLQTKFGDGSVVTPTGASYKTTVSNTNATHRLSCSGLAGTGIGAGANFRQFTAPVVATDFGGPSQTLFRVRLSRY